MDLITLSGEAFAILLLILFGGVVALQLLSIPWIFYTAAVSRRPCERRRLAYQRGFLPAALSIPAAFLAIYFCGLQYWYWFFVALVAIVVFSAFWSWRRASNPVAAQISFFDWPPPLSVRSILLFGAVAVIALWLRPRYAEPWGIARAIGGPWRLTGVDEVIISPDGETLGATKYGSLELWEVKSGRPPSNLFEGTETSAFQFSPDGQRMVVAGGDETVRVWDIRAGRELVCFKGHERVNRYESQSIRMVAFSPDGNSVFSAADVNGGFIWDAHSGMERVRMPDLKVWREGNASFSPDGSRLAVAEKDCIGIRDTRTGRTITQLALGQESKSLVQFMPDGRRLIIATAARQKKPAHWYIWDFQFNMPVVRIEDKFGMPRSISYSPTRNEILLLSSHAWPGIFDARTGALKCRLKFRPDAASYLPDGEHVAMSTSEFGRVVLETRGTGIEYGMLSWLLWSLAAMLLFSLGRDAWLHHFKPEAEPSGLRRWALDVVPWPWIE